MSHATYAPRHSGSDLSAVLELLKSLYAATPLSLLVNAIHGSR